MSVNVYMYDVIWGVVIFAVVLLDILKKKRKLQESLKQGPDT